MYFPIDKKLVIHFFSRIMYVKVKFSWFFSSSKVEILACDYKELEKKKKTKKRKKLFKKSQDFDGDLTISNARPNASIFKVYENKFVHLL